MSSNKLSLGKALMRPVASSRPSTQASQARIQSQSRWEKIAETHAAILSILETTHWPRKSEDSVKNLIGGLKLVPTAQSPSQDDTAYPPANLDKLTFALQIACAKLDAAASKHGASTKPSSFFHRSETCNQVLNACHEEIEEALRTLS
ncbi:hypothetical protein FS837_002417, partial [Tulasnella sp. UAMH 9824]